MNTSRPPCGLVRPQGWKDLHDLAQRFKNIYPTLFNTPYSPEVYKFVHSSAARTKQSCQAFTETLFGQEIMQNSQKYWSTDNLILRVSSVYMLYIRAYTYSLHFTGFFGFLAVDIL